MGKSNNNWIITAVALFIGYSVYSGARKVLSTCSPELKDDLKLTKTEIGSIWSWFAISYGVAKLLGGIASDVLVGRHLFCGGLLLTGVATMAFAESSSLHLHCFLWFCNGIAQGAGWPSLAKIMLDTFPKENLGTIWAAMTMSGNVGYMLSPLAFLYVSQLWGSWRFAFRLAGIGSIICAVCLYPLLPKERTTTTPETETTAATTSTIAADQPKTTSFVINACKSLAQSPAFMFVCLSDVFTYFAIKALNDWTNHYVIESWDQSVEAAAVFVFYSELGGVCGAFLCGPISDMLRGNRAITSVGFSIGAVLSFILLARGKMASSIAHAAIAFIVGFFINAPKTLSGICIKDVTDATLRGTAVGILGLAGQAGAYLSGGPLGHLVEVHGWNIFPPILAVACAGSAVAMCIVALFMSQAKQLKKKSE